MDINQLSLSKLMDDGTLRLVQESFSSATGMSVAAVSKSESVATVEWLGEPEYCACIKGSSNGAELCKKHCAKCFEDATGSSSRVISTCHAGLTTFAVPINTKGTLMGTLLGGKVVTENFDNKKLENIAYDLGLDSNTLINSYRKIDNVPASRVEAATDLLLSMVESMAETGYQSLISSEMGQQARENLSDAEGSAHEIKKKIDDTVSCVKKVEDGCGKIKEATAEAARAVDNTDSIVKTIENASTQLTLIGFNASIEAKRAGAAGAGFNVIAQEVRALSDKNTKQAGEINHTLGGIKKSMADINNQIRALYMDIEKIVDSINDLSYVILEAESFSSDEDAEK